MRVVTAEEFEGPGPYRVAVMFDEAGEEVTYVNGCEYGIVEMPGGERVKAYKDDLRKAIIRSARKETQ